MSTQLYDLIHSMTPAEKRHFKKASKQASQGQGKDKDALTYLKLFDTLDRMKKYDEHKLKTKFEKYAEGKQLAPMKNYLGTSILKSLRESHRKNLIDLQLHEMMSDALILEKKGLDQHALKKLRQVEGKATKFEKHSILIEICRRRVLLYFKIPHKDYLENVEAEYELMEHHLKLLNQTALYEKGLHKMYGVFRSKNLARTEEDRASLKELATQYLQDDVHDSSNFHTKIAHFFGHALYHHLLGKESNLETAHGYYFKVKELWGRYNTFIEEYPKLYIIHLSNYLELSLFLRKTDDFDQVIQKMESVEAESFDEEAELFQTIGHLKVVRLSNSDHTLGERLALRDEVREKMDKYGSKINLGRQISFCYNLGLLFFTRGEYEDSLEWFNRIFDMSSNEHRLDVQRYVRLLRLIVFIEGEAYDFVDIQLENTKRWLKRTDNQLYDEFEYLLISAFKKINSAPDKTSKLQAFTQLEKDLDLFEQKNRGKVILGLKETQLWVAARKDPSGALTPYDYFKKITAES